MDTNVLNISKIETYLHSLLGKKVSANTMVGTLPETTKSSWTDMCLIDCRSAIRDMNAYGRGIVHIWLYAKPLSNGSKNVAKLSKMEESLNEIVSNAVSEHYAIRRRYTYQDYDNLRKWHCNIVEIQITIV